jgi:hypothetical protein
VWILALHSFIWQPMIHSSRNFLDVWTGVVCANLREACRDAIGTTEVHMH